MQTSSGWVWDQHACLPLHVDADLSLLDCYAGPRGGFVSVNVGYAPHSREDSLRLLGAFRSAVAAHPGLVLADTAAAAQTAVEAG